jgi:Clostripain family/Bacterial Ig-like domain/PDZ domain/WD40-like Beta Propeller Repeat
MNRLLKKLKRVHQTRKTIPSVPSNRLMVEVLEPRVLLSSGTEMVSISSLGTQGNDDSFNSSISSDGRYVAFSSDASNLVAGDTNGVRDVFVYNRELNLVERVSISSTGIQGNGPSFRPSISADGKYVAFESNASNLVQGDTNGTSDVFVYDREIGGIEGITVISRASVGCSFIIDNGRITVWKVYEDTPAYDDGILPGDVILEIDGQSTDGWSLDHFAGEIQGTVDTNVTLKFLHPDNSQETFTMTREIITGLVGNGSSRSPSINADGRYVAFHSEASNIVPRDNNAVSDVFVYDQELRIMELVSTSSFESQGDNISNCQSISSDGRYIAFCSDATNLVFGDTNGVCDIYVRDRTLGITERVSISSEGIESKSWDCLEPDISDDGRYVAFWSSASNLVPNDTNWTPDVFVYDRNLDVIERVSTSSDGTEGNGGSYFPNISSDGQYVVFASWASNLVNNDTNEISDLFIYDRNMDIIECLSLSYSGALGNGWIGGSSISNDNCYVTFESDASNLVADDLNGKRDIFVVRNPDDYGDGPDQAHALPISTLLMGNFEAAADVDCFSFQAVTGQEYIIRTATAAGSSVLPTMRLKDTGGNAILLQNDNSGHEKQIKSIWTAPKNGKFYIEAFPQQSESFDPAGYTLSVTDGAADWTFMMYIAADNNLEPYIAPDILEMMLGFVKGDLSTRVNLVMQSDGGEEGEYNNIIWNNSSRRSTFSPIVTNEAIGEKNMGSPETLSDFVNWSITKYPAEHYALVMWDHGGQFLGACSDTDVNGNSDILDMSDFSTAFDNIDTKLDIIGFNACLMAGVEPAYQLKEAADIYIASEPSEYGSLWEGTVWNYTDLFEYLFSNPEVSVNTLAEVIIDSYSELPFAFLDDAISAVDLKIIDDLALSIDGFANFMFEEGTINNWLEVEQARENALQVAAEDEYVHRDLCDLGHFMQEIVQNTQNEELQSIAQDACDVLDDMVLYEWHDNNLSGATGLTIYLPKAGGEVYPAYNQDISFLRDTRWDEFVEVFVSGEYPEYDNISPSAPGTPDLHSSSDSGFSDTDNITNITSPTFTWDAAIDPGDNPTGVSGYQWRVGGGDWSDWQINIGATVDALSDGTHTFYVRAKDYAENIGTEASLEFVIDTIGPTIMAASPLGQLDENFSYLDVTFSEPVDVPALSRVGVEVFGPEGLFYSDSFQPLTADSCRIRFPEQETGGDYRITMGPEVIDLAGNPMEHRFEGEIILPVKVTLGGTSGNTVSFRDADGSNVRVLSIGGQAVVMFAGTNLIETVIYGIPTVIGDNIEIKSIDTICQGNPGMLMITSTGGDGRADLGEINGESLSMIIAQNVNLWGDITMTGSLGIMMVGDIADTVTITTGQPGNGLMVIAGDVGADFDIAGPVNMFMCDSFSSGSLTADKIAMVMPRTGDLDADLTARNGDIGTVIAAGAITGQLSASGNINMLMSQRGGLTGTVRAGNNIGMLMVNGDVSGRVSAMGKINMLMAMGSDITGSVRAGTEIGILMADNLDNALLSAGSNIRMVNIRYDILDSYILGGYDVGTDCAFDIQESGGGDLLNNGNIGFVMAGGSFKRSYIGAGVLPSSTLTGSLPNVGIPATGVGGNIQLVIFGSIDTNAQDDYGMFYSMSRGSVLIGGRLVDDTLDDYFRVEHVS